MVRSCRSRRVTFVLLAVFLLQLIPAAPARAQSAVVVTLSSATTPSAGQPGVHLVSVFGSGFPAGAIDPAAVTVRLAPAPPAVGPSAQTRATTLTTVAGTTRRTSFLVPTNLVVASPTNYKLTLDGISAGGMAFQSGNSSLLLINPPAVILSASPDAAFQGASTPVVLVAQYTNFVQGSTQAAFGPGIRVGGAAPGALGPVTVLSATQAQAQVAIDPGASLGPRSVQVKTGAQEAIKPNAFSVRGPTVTALEPAQLTVAAGGSGSLTVRIQNPDPSNATHVAVSSGNAAVASVPADVVLPAGATEGPVPIGGGVPGGPTPITAALNGSSASAEVTVRERPLAPSLTEPLVEGALLVGGTGVANALVDVQVDAAATGFGTIAADGRFNVAVPALHAGQIVTATQTVGGLVSPTSAPVTVRARPPAPTVTAPLLAGGTQVAGTGVSNAAIDVFVNGALVAIGAADASGAFTITVPALVAGQQVTATQTVAGVTSIPSAPVTVIAVPPAPTVIAPLVEGGTNITGTGVPGASVEVFVEDASVGAAIAGGTTSWSLAISTPLVAGQHVKARQTVGGVASDFSPVVVVVARPPKPTINSPLVEGSVSISGNGVVGADVQVFLDSIPAGTTSVGVGGTWTLALGAPLVAGQTATARQTAGGIQSDLSSPVVVVARPPAPFVNGPLVEGSTTVSGTGIANATIALFVAGGSAGSATVTAAGIWTVVLGAALVAGQPVQARQTVAGIVSDFSPALIVLARPPAPTISAPLVAGATTVQGSGLAGASLEVFANGASLGTTAVGGPGTWSLPLAVALVAGQVITAQQTVAGVPSPLSAPVTVQPALTSIEIAPAPAVALTIGQSVQFSARGTFSDSSIQDPLPGVTWSTDAGAIASISGGGLATAQAAGVANIRATLGAIASSATAVTVKPLPPTVNSPITAGATTVSGAGAQSGAGIQVFVNGVARGGASSANGAGQWTVLALSPALAKNDSVTARQTVNGVQSDASAAVIVIDGTPVLTSIGVTPANLSVPGGTTQAYAATGFFSDGSNTDLTGQVIWQSDHPSVASITAGGLATALDAGSTQITATKNGVTGSTFLTVTPPAVASIVVTPNTPLILAGQTQAFTATGVLTDGSSRNLAGQVSWSSSNLAAATINNASGIAAAAAAGTTTIRATLGAIVGSTDLTVKATASDPTPPTAAITSPAANASITSPTDVIGTANDANFLKYALEIAPAGTTTFTAFGSGTAPVIAGVLGRLDPTTLLNDLYTVRLTVFDRGGNTASASIAVQVTRDQKVGTFTLRFQDLNVPVAGLPIQITRTYDSRNKRSGDFGVGWSLDIQTTRVGANRVQGTAWQMTQSGGFFPTYCIAPTDQHKISITLPDGKVEEFDAAANPACQQIIPPQSGTLSYSARPGTLGTLVPLDGADYFIFGGVGPLDLLDLDLEPIDPQRFQYTSKDGRIFVISKTAGVQSVTDPNGNRLTISPAGITHSSGQSIAFIRDAQGRIVRITDPAGNILQYTYDANGDLASYSDALSNTTRFLYNLNHGLLEIRDPLGRRGIRNEYDDSGKLVANVDAQGHRIEYTHNVGTRQDVVEDRNGFLTIYEYDVQGNVVAITDQAGARSTYTYDANGNRLSATDALGTVTTFTYDSRNNLLSETTLGVTTSHTYDARGRLLTTTDALGRVTTNVYDARGNPITTTDPAGAITRHTYDAHGNETSTTDPLGNVTTFVYDAFDRITSRSDAYGVTTYAYDANGNKTSQRDPRGGVAHFTYDAMSHLVAIQDPEGGIARTEFDATGQVVAGVDPLGNRTTYTYDDANRLVLTTLPDLTSLAYVYDPEGNRTTTTDQLGRVTHVAYDGRKKVITTTFPDGVIVSYAYDALGRRTGITDGLGRTTHKTYDAFGRETSNVDPAGHSTTFEYDAVGNLTSRIDPNGRRTRYVYDRDNRPIQTILPGGQTVGTAYDAAGRKTSETDAAGLATAYAYDALGQVLTVTDPASRVTRFEYDATGNRTAIVDARGIRTTTHYDLANRLTQRILPNGSVENYAYDTAGRLAAKTDALGRTIRYVNDARGHAVTKTYPDASSVSFTYTPTGKRASARDARGTTTYGYDSRDRLTLLTYPDGQAIAYSYDAISNPLSISSVAGAISYIYDNSGRLQQVTDPGGRAVTYSYDAAGNRTGLAYPNGTTASYAYDSNSRLTQIAHAGPGGLLASYAYTLGPSGNRTRADEIPGGTRQYAYDALYRLTGEQATDLAASPLYQNSFAYDAVGNRTTRTATAGAAPPVVTTYSYNSIDELLSEDGVANTWDLNGNLITRTDSAGLKAYQYDFDNRLVRFTAPSGAVTNYAYDVDGNRVERQDASGTLRYLVDTNRQLPQVLAEYSPPGTLLASYVYANDLISLTRGAATAFYHFDGTGSTRLLTGLTGVVTDTFDYDAFGNQLARTGTTNTPFLFSGQQFDATLNLYYLRARYYQPSTGRFTARDPSDGDPLAPLTLHKYVYAGCDPVNKSDPSGRFFCVSTPAWGRFVHQEIGDDFLSGGGDRLSNASINTVLGVPVPGGGLRPDLTDRGTQEVYEIKPVLSAALGAVQLAGYLTVLNTFDPQGRAWTGGFSYRPPVVINIAPGVQALVFPPAGGLIVYCAIDWRALFALVAAALIIDLASTIIVPSPAFAFAF